MPTNRDFAEIHTLSEIIKIGYDALDENVLAFLIGGAESEMTLLRNRQSLDALAFRDCFGCSGPECNRKCDYDLDGRVNNADALAFRVAFGGVCEPLPPLPYPYPYIGDELMTFGASPSGFTLLAAASACVLAVGVRNPRRRREESTSER